MSEQPELAVSRAGDGGADAVHDLVRFVLGDLDELVLQVATFGGYQRHATLPDQIPGKCFITSATVREIGAAEYPCRPLAVTRIVHDSVVSDLIWHLFLSCSQEFQRRQAEWVPHWKSSSGMLPAPSLRTYRSVGYGAGRRRHA